MNDEQKSKTQLITELEKTRKRVIELEEAEAMLRDSAEEYRSIYENVPEVLIRIDKYGKVVAANDHSSTFGRTPEDIIGKKFTELGFFELKDIPKYWALFKDVITGKKTVVDMELNVKHKDGHKIPVEVNTSLFRKNGKIEGFVSVARDITERKRAEWEIHQRNEELAVINTIAAEVSRSLNLDEILNTALDRVLDLMQLDIGGIFFFDRPSKKLSLAVHRGVSKELFSEVNTINIDDKTLDVAMKRGKRGNFVFSIQTVLKNRVELKRIGDALKKEGFGINSTVPVLLHARENILGILVLVRRQPRQLTDSEQRLLTSIAQQVALAIENARLYEEAQIEITEHKLTERALQESEERFRTFFENEPEYCYMISPEGIILDVNTAAMKVLGYRKGELVGNPLKMVYAPETIPQMEQVFKKWRASGKLRDEEMVIITKDGNRRNVLLSSNSVLDSDGNVRHSVSIQRDITDRKQVENEIEKQNEELAALNAIAAVVSQSLNLDEVLNAALEKVMEVMQVDAGGIFLADLEHQRMNLAVHRGLSKEFTGELATVRINKNYISTALDEAKEKHFIVSMESIFKDRLELNRIISVAEKEGLIVDFTIPVLLEAKGKIQGWMNIASRTPRKFTEAEIRLLTSIAQQIAVAIDNARLYEAATQEIAERRRVEDALRESEEKFSKAFHSSPNIMAITTIDEGRIINVNDAYCRLTGYRRDELIGKTTPELNIWGNPAQRDVIVKRLKENKRVSGLEVQRRTKSGELRTLSYSGGSVTLNNEKHLLSVATDITERKRVEEELRKSELKYRSLVDGAGAGIVTIDTEGRYTYVNEVFCRAVGFSEEEIIGSHFTEFLHPEDKERILKLFSDNVTEPNLVTEIEFRLIHKDGSIYYIHSRPTVTLFNDEIIGFNAILTDITERKRAEEALQESEKKYRNLVDNAPIGIATTEANGNILYANESLLRMMEFESVEEISNIDITKYSNSDDREELHERLKQGPVSNFETEMRTKNGKNLDILISASMEGELLSGMILDITERKRILEALRVSEQKFRSLFEHVPVGIYQGTPGGRLFTVNPALVDMLGYNTSEEMRGDNQIKDLYMNPEDWGSITSDLESKDELRNVEVALKRKDGTPVTALENVSAVRYENGRVRYYEGMFVDISERKRAELEIERNTEDIRLINDLNHAANEGASLAEIIDIMSRETVRIFRSHGATVYLLSDDSKTLVVQNMPLSSKILKQIQKLVGMKIQELHLPKHADSLYWQVLHDKGPLLIKNEEMIGKQVMEYANEVNVPNASLRRSIRKMVPIIQQMMNIKSAIMVPLYSDEGAIGLIDISGEDELTEADLHRLEIISGQLAGIIVRKQAEEALRESEEKYRAIFEQAVDSIVLFDGKTGEIAEFNDSTCEILGYTREEFKKLKIPDFEAIESADEVFEHMNKITTGGADAFETKQRTKQGDIRDVMITARAIPIHGKDLIMAIWRDITERKQVEEALRESEGKYRSLVESSEDPIYLVDKDLRFVFANAKYLSRLKKSLNEIIGRKLADFDIPRRTEKFSEIIEEVLVSKKPVSYEHKSARDNRNFLRTLSPVVDPSTNNVIAVTVISKDITELKQSEEALRVSEERYRELADSITDIFYAFDKDLRYTYWNKASEILTGIAAKDAIGKSLYEIFPDSPQTRKSDKVYRNVLKTKRPETFITKYQIGGESFFLEINVYPSRDGISVFTKDITERKLAEEKLTQSGKQLRNLSFYLQTIREEERGAVAREIHDELGQELTAIKMDLSWLNKKIPQDQTLLLDRISGMTELANSMIQTVKRITSELRPAVLDDLGVAAALEWEIGEFQKRTGYACELVIEPEEFELDPGRSTAVYRIFQESLTNVARHARATSVAASLAAGEEALEMIIRDNGVGISVDQLESQESFGLIGIRERARQYGGEASITGVVGEGTTITVKIPYEKDEVQND